MVLAGVTSPIGAVGQAAARESAGELVSVATVRLDLSGLSPAAFADWD
jgi:hypothetical protein